jgi:hypothetical protein
MRTDSRRYRRPASFAFVAALLGMMIVVPLGAAAQSESAPTVGEIVVDSYDCASGELRFHVPVTDLPHDPIDDGSLGYSIVAHYEQGSDRGLPGFGFNVAEEDSPYTGDVHLTRQVAPDGADSASPDSAAGPIRSIEINLGVGYDGGSGPSDSTSTTFAVDCDDAGADVDPTPSATNGDAEETTAGDTTDTDVSNNDGAADTDVGDVEDTDTEGIGDGDTNGSAASGPTSDTDADDTTDADTTTADDQGETEDTRQLPATGAGPVVQGSADMVLVTLLGSIAAVLGLTALQVRQQAERPRR